MQQTTQPTVTEVEKTLNRGKTAVKTTPEKPWRPNPRLTDKENAFIQHVVNHPKDSKTEAVFQTYNVKDRLSAANIAAHLQKKPHIMAELVKYSETAETNLTKLANITTDFAMQGGKEGAAYAGVAERVNNSILDRIHGKATQKTESASLAVTLNVDLSGATG